MENGKRTKKGFKYIYLSVVLLYIWALVFIIDAKLNIADSQSKIFPYFVGGLAIVVATIILLKSIKGKERDEDYDFSGSFKVAKFSLVLIAYVIAIMFLGYYISTAIFLFTGMWMLGQRNIKVMIAVSIATPLIIYLFFDLALQLQIPTGILFN